MTAQREGRLAVWQRGLDTLSERPWGVGVGAYQVAEMAKSGYMRAAHNSLLEISVELGVVGGVLYLLLWLRAWRVLGQLMDRAVAPAAARRGRRARAPPVPVAREAEKIEEHHDPATAHVPEHWAIHAQHLRASVAGLLGAGFFISQAYSLLAFTLLAVIAGLESRYLPRAVALRVAPGARVRRRRRAGYTPA